MRKWFILYLIVVNISLFAIIKSVAPQAEEIELVFNNVKIKSLEFIDENEFRIDAKKSTGVDITIDNNKVIFTAPEMTRVKLELPSFKKYLYRSDDGVCRFDSEHLIIEAEDGELIEFKDGNLLIIDEDKTRVEVGEKGIYVFENDETVEISSRGIIVDGEEEYKEITGFWGKLLGGVITAITRGSMHAVGKRPEKIMKYMINDQDDEENIDVWIADDEDEDEDLVREEFHKKIKPEADDRIKVINHNGAVTVEVWDEDEIDIYAELKTRKGKSELKKVELIVDEQGGLLIETRHLKKNPAVTVNYLIRIPSTTALESITSNNGRIKISGARGDVELDTSNGSIVIDNFQGNIDAGTSNGSIKVKSVKGNV
ncbi:MAG: hypothetical protein JXB60_04665, partial [Candidatus Cloacimonetes bacterium]|nr:hypothetical protein [Candidatus Cloacimonadota bacterium]